MDKFRKFTAIVSLIVLVLSLAGCASSADTDAAEGAERLKTLLNQLEEDVQDDGLGVGGAVKYAAKFIAWGKNNSLEADEITTIVLDWLKERTPEMRQKVQHWISEIAEAGKDILSRQEDVKQAIEDSGWQEKVNTILNAILEFGGIE